MKIFRRKIIFLFIIASLGYTSCSLDGEFHTDMDSLYPETSLKGWQLSESNTGLCNDYSNLELIDAATVGRIQGDYLYITIPGVTVSHKQINYPVIIESSGVTVDHCLIRPTSCSNGVEVVHAGDATIRDTEIDCSLIPLEQVGFSIAIVGVDSIIERCNIHGASSGISIHNTSETRFSVAQGNYVHGLRLYNDAHVDGLTIRHSSGAGIIVRNNYIKVEPNPATGSVFIQALYGHINNVLVKGNLLQGYGYCLAVEYNTYGYGNNMQSINNRYDAWTGWYNSISGGSGWYEWYDNYIYIKKAISCKGSALQEP